MARAAAALSERQGALPLFSAQRAVDEALLASMFRLAGPAAKSRRLGEAVLGQFGSIANALRASSFEWRRVPGMTDAALGTLSLMQATVKSACHAPANDRAILLDWNDLIAYLKIEMTDHVQERFRVLFLNNAHHLIADELMSVGTLDQAAVYPREVMRRALALGATRLILVHNHPSGELRPSAADVALTREIDATGLPLDVRVHDHVIIAGGGYSSFRILGLM